MNSRRSYLAQLCLAGGLILVGTCWVSGQQGRPREAYRPQEDLGGHEFRAGSRFETNGMQPAPNSFVLGQRSSALVGSCVKLADGQMVGRIDDLMINEDGCVDFMVVSFNGSSEFRGRLAAIPWNVGKMDFGARIVTLNIERDALREAPIFFSRGPAWPNLYEPQWAATVHNYFGVETDIDRRVERAYGTPEGKDLEQGDRDEQPLRDQHRREMPRPRDIEQRRDIQQPRDKHLDSKPAPMPDGNLIPEPGLDRNGDRTFQGKDRDTIRDNNNNDDEFSGKQADRIEDRTNNQDEKDDEGLNGKEQNRDGDSPLPPE